MKFCSLFTLVGIALLSLLPVQAEDLPYVQHENIVFG